MGQPSTYKYDMKELHQMTIDALEDRGVCLEDIAEIVFGLQEKYFPDLTMEL